VVPGNSVSPQQQDSAMCVPSPTKERHRSNRVPTIFASAAGHRSVDRVVAKQSNQILCSPRRVELSEGIDS
jgi:hypothetical protein